ncbi:MAG: hypothetical protein CEN90_195 [Parcubacteria group bacterium Licking1014_17]|nr:MAG: hypothetical protein CEN90_195 [Parcubacteria group bacterium Licking1014_17]
MNQEEKNNFIREILENLYKSEPSLRSEEQIWMKVITAFMEVKPNVELNQDFKNELKIKLLDKIADLRNAQKSGEKPAILPVSRRYYFAFGTIAVLLAIIIPSIYFLNKNKPAFESNAPGTNMNGKSGGEAPQLANPASVYCERQSGKLDIRNTQDGQAGYCVFKDGSECEEWKYFRNECKPGEIFLK